MLLNRRKKNKNLNRHEKVNRNYITTETNIWKINLAASYSLKVKKKTEQNNNVWRGKTELGRGERGEAETISQTVKNWNRKRREFYPARIINGYNICWNSLVVFLLQIGRLFCCCCFVLKSATVSTKMGAKNKQEKLKNDRKQKDVAVALIYFNERWCKGRSHTPSGLLFRTVRTFLMMYERNSSRWTTLKPTTSNNNNKSTPANRSTTIPFLFPSLFLFIRFFLMLPNFLIYSLPFSPFLLYNASIFIVYCSSQSNLLF